MPGQHGETSTGS